MPLDEHFSSVTDIPGDEVKWSLHCDAADSLPRSDLSYEIFGFTEETIYSEKPHFASLIPEIGLILQMDVRRPENGIFPCLFLFYIVLRSQAG